MGKFPSSLTHERTYLTEATAHIKTSETKGFSLHYINIKKEKALRKILLQHSDQGFH